MNNAYWVIGAEGQSYGPADEGTLAQWGREGRLNAQSILQHATSNQRVYAGQVPGIAAAFQAAYPQTGSQQPGYQQPVGHQQQQTAMPAGYGAGYQQPTGYQQPSYPHPAAQAQMMMAYDANKKSAVVAYVLWWFVGMFGAHRYYLGRNGSATAMLVITLVSLPLMFVVIGFATLMITGVWAIVDAFLIPGIVREENLRLAAQMR